MKKSVVILGTTQFSKRVYHTIIDEGIYDVAGFCVEQAYITEPTFCDLPVLDVKELCNSLIINELSFKWGGVINTIGYKQMNRIRERLTKKYGDKLPFISYISKYAHVDTSATIGDGTLIMPYVYIGSNCNIGKGVIIDVGATLPHDIFVGNYSFVACHVVCGGNINMGRNCFIGLNATIKNGVKIADYTFVGAACYITKDTESESVYIQHATPKSLGIIASQIIERV